MSSQVTGLRGAAAALAAALGVNESLPYAALAALLVLAAMAVHRASSTSGAGRTVKTSAQGQIDTDSSVSHVSKAACTTRLRETRRAA